MLLLSKAEVTSSNNNISGVKIKFLINAILCFSPPDNKFISLSKYDLSKEKSIKSLYILLLSISLFLILKGKHKFS